jgi:hypothetical protein
MSGVPAYGDRHGRPPIGMLVIRAYGDRDGRGPWGMGFRHS